MTELPSEEKITADWGDRCPEHDPGCFCCQMWAMYDEITALRERCADLEAAPVARTKDEWHEDDGPVTWWKFPVEEPSWIGTPNDDDWPWYHTHWTPHPTIPAQDADARAALYPQEQKKDG